MRWTSTRVPSNSCCTRRSSSWRSGSLRSSVGVAMVSACMDVPSFAQEPGRTDVVVGRKIASRFRAGAGGGQFETWFFLRRGCRLLRRLTRQFDGGESRITGMIARGLGMVNAMSEDLAFADLMARVRAGDNEAA